MAAPFRFSSQVVTLRGDHGWSLINWLNLENFRIEDARHPLYECLESGTEHDTNFIDYICSIQAVPIVIGFPKYI
ncbi:MAG: hypothetical protein HOJ87_05990 [Rhodospirillaceae bacterium]|jgi:hypothetical protein|nr:hypothetical protein [Rhodospirillaceae bacterium]